jgi:hypothetical protein
MFSLFARSRRLQVLSRSILGCGALLSCLAATSVGAQEEDRVVIRWDLISLDISTMPPTTTEGGIASSRAVDGSKMTLTGRGTFNSFDPTDVSGGGQWYLFDPNGKLLDQGQYFVTNLVSFIEGPGRTATIDLIAPNEDSRAGLAMLRIRYSDGSRGTLLVSCHLQGTPDNVFEGITVSKGFVDYWNREPDEPGVDANRTIFHVLR